MNKDELKFEKIENIEGQLEMTPNGNYGVSLLAEKTVKNNENDSESLENEGFEDYSALESGYKVDWLSFTVSDSFILDDILKDLGYILSEFEICNGRNFYNAGLTLGNYVNIYYNDYSMNLQKNTNESINFVFTGQGCSDLWNRIGSTRESLFNTFLLLKEKYQAKITRFDLAFDDFEGIFDLDLIEYKLNQSEFRSCKQSYNIVKSSDIHDNKLGRTIYIGKARSDSGVKGNYYVRFYDKKAQYEEKKQVVPDIVEKSGIWNRAEISFTKKKADDIFSNLIYGTDENIEDIIFKSVMRNLVEFLEPTEIQKKARRKQRDRWKKSEWWQNYLNDNSKYHFVNHERDIDIYTSLSWISDSVAPTLKILNLICDKYDINFFDYLIDNVFNTNKPFSKKQIRFFHDSLDLEKDELLKILEKFKKRGL